MFSKIKFVIFDLDGTLVDSSEGVVEATNYALKKLGQPIRGKEEISRFIGYPLDVMFPTFCDAPVTDLKAAFQEKAAVVMQALTHPLPGTEDILAMLAGAGFTMAVATTKFKIHTDGIIDKFGWRKYFKALASGDEVRHVKPAPDLVDLAIRRLDADKEKTVMVGDTVNDIYSAKGAGIKTIAVVSPFGNDDLAQAGPDRLLNSLNDLRMVFDL
jgi:phosphoglycolate phosphatase